MSFNSRAPRGARPHAHGRYQADNGFQFTCPSRSTTYGQISLDNEDIVSIHVPLAEHDRRSRLLAGRISCFNSRAPRGARRTRSPRFTSCSAFQFTCPSRSTTGNCRAKRRNTGFQFTCPSRSTTAVAAAWKAAFKFQFTCPSRSTTSTFGAVTFTACVSIHVPLAEHDSPPPPGRSAG